jgi:large subunit ribosomal protein L20
MKLAEGYYGAKSRLYRIAMQAVDRALVYAYRDRRNRKRDFRKLWITRISAAAKLNDISYSHLMDGLKKAGIQLNRKMLADLAVKDPDGFKNVAMAAKRSTETV